LIKELIPGIVRDIKGFENMIMYLNNPLPGCDESYTQILDGDCYVYVKGKIIMEESEPSELLKGGTFKSFEFEYAINGATKRKGLLLLKRSCKNVNDVVVELNQTYINRVAQPALEMNQKYLTWCERRVREWVEKPLTPVME
jgi:hypothetical protein